MNDVSVDVINDVFSDVTTEVFPDVTVNVFLGRSNDAHGKMHHFCQQNTV